MSLIILLSEKQNLRMSPSKFPSMHVYMNIYTFLQNWNFIIFSFFHLILTLIVCLFPHPIS